MGFREFPASRLSFQIRLQSAFQAGGHWFDPSPAHWPAPAARSSRPRSARGWRTSSAPRRLGHGARDVVAWQGASPPLTLCFAALGMAYIMIEPALMQKFALLLGDPLYSGPAADTQPHVLPMAAAAV